MVLFSGREWVEEQPASSSTPRSPAVHADILSILALYIHLSGRNVSPPRPQLVGLHVANAVIVTSVLADRRALSRLFPT